jgi:hypothetical protein
VVVSVAVSTVTDDEVEDLRSSDRHVDVDRLRRPGKAGVVVIVVPRRR